MKSKERPYVLFVAEKIYLEVSDIKKDNPDFSNIDAIDAFMGSKTYQKISKGEFHDEWFNELKRNNKIKIDKSKELEKLIQIETNKQLNQFSRIYFDKSKINYSISEK